MSVGGKPREGKRPETTTIFGPGRCDSIEGMEGTCMYMYVHVHVPIEVGCRGYVAHSFCHFLSLMAFPRIQLSTIAKRTSQVTLQASYLIFKARHGQVWHQFDLVSRPSPGALRQLFPSLQSSAPLPLALQSTPTEPNLSCPALELL